MSAASTTSSSANSSPRSLKSKFECGVSASTSSSSVCRALACGCEALPSFSQWNVRLESCYNIDASSPSNILNQSRDETLQIDNELCMLNVSQYCARLSTENEYLPEPGGINFQARNECSTSVDDDILASESVQAAKVAALKCDFSDGKSCSAHTHTDYCHAVEPYARTCAVCGGYALTRHFNASACNACAAFFRRTVSGQKTYVCKRGKNCPVQETNRRHICRYCRFQRCIHVGMDVAAVLTPICSRDGNAENERGFLSRILAARHSIYVNRNHAIVHVYGGHDRVVAVANKHKDARYSFYSLCAEMIVIREFFKYSQLDQNAIEPDSRKRFFYSWILCENLLITARNGGFRTGRFFFVDESYKSTRYDELLDYYKANPAIRYPDTVARSAVEFHKETLTLAARFHEARLDDAERAALSFIFTTITGTTARNVFGAQLMELMRELKLHYEHTYDDVAVRMGSLILLLTEFQRVHQMFEKHTILLRLNDKQCVYDRINGRSDCY